MSTRIRALHLLPLSFALACAVEPAPLDTGDTGDERDADTGDDAADTRETSADSDDSGEAPCVPEPPPGFIPDMDPGDGSCDPYAHDCPEGEKCVPDFEQLGETSTCVPVTDNGQVGEACKFEQGLDDCDASAYCWNVNEEGVGRCIGFCGGSADDPLCPAKHECIGLGAIVVCSPLCDPLAQDCSNDGEGCYWAGNTFNCSVSTGSLPEGQPCAFFNDCSPGSVCLDESLAPTCVGPACCTVFCALDNPVCPVMGTACVPFFDPNQAPPGYENLGACVA